MPQKFSISKITPFLYVSGWPKKQDAEMVKKMNFDLILHLIWQPTDKLFKDDNVNLHRIVMIDSPMTPLPIKRLEKGVKLALPIIHNGGKVLVYCKQGVHRSMAMASCILIAEGHSLEETAFMMKKNREVTKPHTGYIKSRIVKFEKHWNKKNAK